MIKNNELKPYGSFISLKETEQIFEKKKIQNGTMVVLEEGKGGLYRYTPVLIISLSHINKRIDITAPIIETTGEFNLNGLEAFPKSNYQKRLLPPLPDIWQASIRGLTWKLGDQEPLIFKPENKELIKFRIKMKKQNPWKISKKSPLYETYLKLTTVFIPK